MQTDYKEITLRIDKNLAELYNSYSEREKTATERIVAMILKREKKRRLDRMFATMDRIGKKAKERGMTEEILNDILKEID